MHPECISEQLSRESCSAMRPGTHSNAAAPRIFAERAFHANTIFWCSHGARVACEMRAVVAADGDSNCIIV
eukprot:2966762-Lingulodinium_polyedra.AAC.1